jgi:fructoselysine-6-P-deglycase FrlB-like protein
VPTATLPLKPIEDGFVDKFRSTIAQRPVIEKFAADLVAVGLRNVFFVGAGGSLISGYPAHYLLQRKAPFPVFQVQSDEFNTAGLAQLGASSLVVVSSHTGTTKETVAAAKTAKNAGATVVAIAKAGSPLAEASDLALTAESRDLAMLLIAYALLEATDAAHDYAAIQAALEALPEALVAAVQESEELLHGIAEALADEEITYVLGSGPSYGWAYGLAMCYLQEMQWKHAAAFNAGEFFQGAFEVVNDDVPVLLLLGEDASRPMVERAKAFLDRYTKKAHYIDVRNLTLPGVPAQVRPDVSPIVIGALMSRLAQHYESVRGHDLKQRHYMFKVDY